MYEVSLTLVPFHLLARCLHAPRYRIKFRGYLSIYRWNMLVLSGKTYLLQVTKEKHFFSDVYRNKQRWVAMPTNPHNFNKRILLQSNPLFQSWTGVQRSYTSRRNLSYTRSFSAKADQGAWPLGFSHVPESLALIGLTDWGLMRHSLREKTI